MQILSSPITLLIFANPIRDNAVEEEKATTIQIDSEKVQKKLKLSNELYQFALRIKTEQLRQKHPEKSEDEIRKLAQLLIEKANS